MNKLLPRHAIMMLQRDNDEVLLCDAEYMQLLWLYAGPLPR